MSLGYTPQEFIRKQRDGEPLPDEELVWFVNGIVDGTVTEGQIAAFAMAVFQRGMNGGELITLTKAMRDSGKKLSWDLPGPILDKHSTGGVGDLVSLVLAPLLASCGGYVPMIAGRGLGHTGGTLDKLESIPGYNTTPDNELFRKIVSEVGCAIIGQTGELAPADGKMYAVRDVTATIESGSLISSSIISKKLAAGINCLVLDVKAGNGAFMTKFSDARRLAVKLADLGRACGMKVSSLVTDMSQPLADSAGNALEVREAINFLTGDSQNERLRAVIAGLAEESLLNSDLVRDDTDAKMKIRQSLESGKAAEYFSKMVSTLGGPSDLLENPDKHLPKAKVIKPLLATQSGYVHSINTKLLGEAVNRIGGGRTRVDQEIDHSVGFTEITHIADRVEKDEPLLMIHADSDKDWQSAAWRAEQAYSISSSSINPNDAVLEVIHPTSHR
ncbi:thymidine phosphorylase [Rubritalea squalenifaciens DSM 18772]|uniref:thymidine phosphorylase n=1 Tax=Rubritalea squalenifaciens DSM 18772 TaxID=1123071 RepID=A0A1M6DYQ1_9BACT|nr:thymidine phosphorylase [Rubritalea squalenifaciens]SHI78260.1 thymidine phosphorylase [Rubritalea squalenifaciens DSM 18772]